MKILILGGNRFFGKRLAQMLIDRNHEVTLLNRGNLKDEFGNRLNRIFCDRDDRAALAKAVGGHAWDIVYDQICFDYDAAVSTCEVFSGKTKKYIFTSTQSVYNPGQNISEEVFDPALHQFSKKESKTSNYGEAKRQAEVAFHKFASFPVISARLPIVIGPDDYTGRFQFHIRRIQNGEPLYFPNVEAKMSFVTSEFAAQALYFLSTKEFVGPINIASPNPIRLKDFLTIIEKAIGKKALLENQSTEKSHSPYGIKRTGFWIVANCKS